ncbi:unnamed protein product [Closterium sp. NIES-53]
MASYRSTGTYVNTVPPPGANVISGMWLYEVKRPPGAPSVFKARYVARGLSQRERVDFFQTFIPTPKMTTLRVLLHIAAQRDYELRSLEFSTTWTSAPCTTWPCTLSHHLALHPLAPLVPAPSRTTCLIALRALMTLRTCEGEAVSHAWWRSGSCCLRLYAWNTLATTAICSLLPRSSDSPSCPLLPTSSSSPSSLCCSSSFICSTGALSTPRLRPACMTRRKVGW